MLIKTENNKTKMFTDDGVELGLKRTTKIDISMVPDGVTVTETKLLKQFILDCDKADHVTRFDITDLTVVELTQLMIDIKAVLDNRGEH